MAIFALLTAGAMADGDHTASKTKTPTKMLTSSGGAPVSTNSIDNSNSDSGEKKVEDNSIKKTSSDQDTDNNPDVSTSNDKADPTSSNKNS